VSSSRKNQGRGQARYFDRFRAEVADYAEGVHRLGDPVAARDRHDLPEEMAAFYESWDGAELFIDAYVIRPLGGLEHEDELLWFGDSALGDHFALDPRDGRVLRLEEDTGELLVEATSFSRFVEALVVAEGVYYDREGDFLEDVFGDEGDEIGAAARVKREKRALKIDPDAPAPTWRLARALEKQDDAEGARKLLEKLVVREPGFAWAWFDLGRLRMKDGELPGAQEAFEKAAEAGAAAEHEQAGWFCAHAARVAAERKDEPARARLAARALELDPEVARAQRRAAQDRVDDDRLDEARELVALAAALLPRDLEVAELRRRLARK
jgi:tetratricopeptide (TPR) repeat protein